MVWKLDTIFLWSDHAVFCLALENQSIIPKISPHLAKIETIQMRKVSLNSQALIIPACGQSGRLSNFVYKNFVHIFAPWFSANFSSSSSRSHWISFSLNFFLANIISFICIVPDDCFRYPWQQKQYLNEELIFQNTCWFMYLRAASHN